MARRTHHYGNLGYIVGAAQADVVAVLVVVAAAADDSSSEQHVHSERDARDAVELRQHSHSDSAVDAAAGHLQRSLVGQDVRNCSILLDCSHHHSYCWCSQHPARDFIE